MRKPVLITLLIVLLLVAAFAAYLFFWRDRPSTIPGSAGENARPPAAQAEGYEAVAAQFRLGNLPEEIGDEQEAIKLFGEPAAIEKTGANGPEEWIYEGIRLRVLDDYVLEYGVTVPDYPTVKGVKAGDPLTEAKKVYPGGIEQKNRRLYRYEQWTTVGKDQDKVVLIYHLDFVYDEQGVITQIWTGSEID